VPFVIRDLIAATVRPVGVRAHQKGLELVTDIAPDVPQVLVSDPGRLRQVLANLLGNAIKFTSEGHVLLAVELQESRGDRAVLHFQVLDTGIGIPEDKQQLIFEPFSQADGSTTRRFGGTGLGLTISSKLVSLMGGELWVESVVGQGSAFHFTAVMQVGEEVPEEQPLSLAGLAVLVVDDMQLNRRVMERTLRRWRIKPTAVGSAQEALEEVVAAARRGAPYPMALIDMQMPDIDGFELARRLKCLPEARGLSVLMLSSSGEVPDPACCRELGIAGCASKPVSQGDLLRLISRTLGTERAETPRISPAPSSPSGSVKQLRILLAEDNVINRRLALQILTARGHDVTAAENGREAIEAVERNRFDVVLMDVQMPEMSGVEATRVIRDREKLSGAHLPIIAMTAHAMKGDRERCLDSGMDGYIAKPIDREQLLRLVEADWTRPALDLPAPMPEGPPAETATRTCDVDAFIRRAGGDRGLAQEMARLFASEAPGMLANVRSAVSSGNPERVRQAAHALKGAASNFDAADVVAAALTLERMGREGSLEGAGEPMTRLETAADVLMEALHAFAMEAACAS
jgi:CheY-like chemotaxis protein/HPt (histidine-containing phosphotransfer) domain-containing protein